MIQKEDNFPPTVDHFDFSNSFPKLYYSTGEKKGEIKKEGENLITYLYYFFHKSSPYYDMPTNDRSSIILEDHLKESFPNEKKFDDWLKKEHIKDYIKKYKRISFTRERRLIMGANDRIDVLIDSWTDDVGDITGEAIVKEIGVLGKIDELIAIKRNLEKLEKDNNSTNTKGGKKIGFLESTHLQ